jgi:PIF1-like helicase
MVVHCRPSNCSAIMEMFLPELCGCSDPSPQDVDCTMWALDVFCNEMGHSLIEYGFVMPEPRMIVNYPSDDIDLFCHNRDVAFGKFSDEQRAAAEEILEAIAMGRGGIFYVQASGGCGKSFFANGVCAAVRAQGQKPVVVAASGLAATLLDGGRTAHSTFPQNDHTLWVAPACFGMNAVWCGHVR